MKDQKPTHLDCVNFVPVDVTKGFCLLSKELILADSESCARFIRQAKCKHCYHYLSDETNSLCGHCAASAEKFIAYAEMVARTCRDYQPLRTES